MNKKIIQNLRVASFFIFGCFLTSLVFSPKVSAFDFNMPIVDLRYETGMSGGICGFYQSASGGSSNTSISNASCSTPSSLNFVNPYSLTYIESGTSKSWDTSRYYKLSFSLFSPSTSYTPVTGNIKQTGWYIVDINQDWDMSTTEYCDQYKLPDTGGLNEFYCASSGLNYRVSHWTFILRPSNNSTKPVSIGNLSSGNLFVFRAGLVSSQIIFEDVYSFQPLTIKDDIAEAEQKTEEATNEGESNADASESQNEGASQSLITTFGQVFGAFSTSASDCNLDMDLGNADFGTINLCSGKPVAISAILTPIGTIIMVYAIFLCSRSIFRLFVKISAFAQGGSSNG